ncbi:centrosomal protein cep290 [Topomyia yanbarensis]|uniref:centrosomal protein cep290 n=1 Tax=Topomyia yanbarensis TaxID=2498891 RepID=UPI00273B8A2C|nr:centrosomal protein cep290 [Topomyia yanbarensis]
MDWRYMLSVSPHNVTHDRTDELAANLSAIPTDQKMDSKGCKKLFRLAQVVLRFRNEQVTQLKVEVDRLTRQNEQREMRDSSAEELFREQINELKRTVEKLEVEKHANRAKIKDMTEEIVSLQRKLAESSHFGSEGEDSPDALSEIDRQQELYNNISMKNKHIKRLLRDIEDLDRRNNFQIDTINSLQISLNDATKNLTALTHQYEESKIVIRDQGNRLEEASEKIKKLDEEVSMLAEEKTRCEDDLEDFAKRLEAKTTQWKAVLATKQGEIEELQSKYSALLEQFPGYDIERERKEFKQMVSRLSEKDQIIEQLEQKITMLSQEIIASTELMNRISQEKESTGKEAAKVSQCCEESRVSLDKAHKRCEEMQEILTSVEEDNMLKSKQAVEAIEALRRYESGEDGLSSSLKKINRLHEKVNVRDKQIRELIAEINLANEIALENAVLRKRLGISEDEPIPTHSVLSKQRKIEKVNERLALKLRASEEMRLQLKLEKNDLKRKLFQMSQSLGSQRGSDKEKSDELVLENGETVKDSELVSVDVEDESKISDLGAVKFCEKCMKQYNIVDSMKYCKACIFRQNFNYCDGCIKKLKVNFNEDEASNSRGDQRMEELEKKYTAVEEENENLRIGMHEILQKLRDYDAMSNHLTIDTTTLEKLIKALNARSSSEWFQSELQLRKELLESRERFNLKSKQSTLSLTSRDDSGNVCDDEDNIVDIDQGIAAQPDFSEQILLKSVEIDRLNEQLELLKEERDNLLKSNDELQVTKNLYDELLQFTRATDNEKDTLLVNTLDRLKQIESNIFIFQRKIDFLKAENDNMYNTMRSLKLDHLNVLHGLKFELAQKTGALKRLEQSTHNTETHSSSQDSESVERLEKEIERMKQETTNFYTIFLKNIPEVDREHLLDFEYDSLSRFGLVESNLTVDFMPKDEFKRIKHRLAAAEEDLKRQHIKAGHLGDLLRISQEQIQSQQSLISKYSDEEISLRHLVADLQSSSNEKYLLVKTQKELDAAREQEELLKLDNARMKQSLLGETAKIDKLKQQLVEQELDFINQQKDNNIKIKFLTQSVKILHENYNSFTPTYAVTDFVQQYTKLLEQKRELYQEKIRTQSQSRDEEYERLFARLRDNLENSQIQDKINLIKFESQCEYLTKQLILSQEQIEQFQQENLALKLREVETTRHWDTIELIFNGEAKANKRNDMFFDKEIQVSVEISHKCINTIPIIDGSLAEIPRQGTPPSKPAAKQAVKETGQMTDHVEESTGTSSVAQKSLESQLKQAMMLASTRSALLLETESRLTECHGRIKLLEKTLEDKEVQLKKEKSSHTEASGGDTMGDGVLSSTIGSLQNLLLQKDTTLSKYQELLRNEREEHSKSYDENISQIRSLKKTVDELEQKQYDKQKEVDNLTTQLRDLNEKRAQQEADAAQVTKTVGASSNKTELVYTDNIIENIYELDQKKEDEIEALRIQLKVMENKLLNATGETKSLQGQLKESTAKEKRIEMTLREKEADIRMLNEKLTREYDDLKEFTDNVATAQEVEQLKEMLEDKDRHIQDLTETLSQFHDDQQRFMTDTSLHSAEQVSQLSADLNRSEASNRVLKTQIDALKRQIISIQQREKQSRDLVKTLKNQLIKRPVIAMKQERIPTPREDQLVRKVQQLETELLDTKDELRKQVSINENRRAKNAAELDLWNKQKRWQQIADKLKIQLKDRETELEKLKVHFNSAKAAIVRMEREKAMVEGRSLRGISAGSGASGKFGSASDNKYTTAESPDCCTSESTGSDGASPELNTFAQNSKEIIDALKNRIESQQRRIIAMELERKGSNSMTHELERMQEKISSLEAQNIRLEAKSLQLQLDNDMLRQSNESDRLRSQTKHLEDYIIVLKEELTKATTGCPETINFDNLCQRCARSNVGGTATTSELASYNAKLEQTVIALRRVVEKLKVDNKQLKEVKPSSATSLNGKMSIEAVKENYDRLKREHDKLQQNYNEALNRVAALQVEVELLSSANCPRCYPREEKQDLPEETEEGKAKSEELKENLEKKTQLLEKAKLLLTRAAAKERYLKEQISLLRRKCSDLQNVPVIDEISE